MVCDRINDSDEDGPERRDAGEVDLPCRAAAYLNRRMKGIRLEERIPTVEEYVFLRDAVGWPPRGAAAAREGLSRSIYSICCVGRVGIVGCGRIVGDGGLYLYLQDIIVRPECQRRGLGTRIIRSLLTYIEKHNAPGVFVGLMAASGASRFYRRFGFEARGSDAPGMFMILADERPEEQEHPGES
ncbi:MAG: GNAT family N-acetyltransferase [Deltaproteobacteria bacterium]|nr:GNAT family N-acetyltransferase [Deltaproteobacteria bacterium]